MPQQIEHNNNTYLFYDFDCGRDRGMADLRNSISDNLKKKQKPYIVISNAFEGTPLNPKYDEADAGKAIAL